jgi:uncharacterized membrane protein
MYWVCISGDFPDVRLYQYQRSISVDKGRVEAFSDGVLSIIITIMVLQFQAPKSVELSALFPLIPKFLS